MEIKKVLLLGTVAILAILGARSCTPKPAMLDEAKSETTSVAKEAKTAKEAAVAKAAKMVNATPPTPAVKKARHHHKAAQKHTHKKHRGHNHAHKKAPEAPVVTPVTDLPVALMFEHHKSHRYIFATDAK